MTVARDPRAELAALMEAEHRFVVPREAVALADEIRRRHGASVSAVLFYGSCLREQQLDGLMLDFYLIVSDYRAYRAVYTKD